MALSDWGNYGYWWTSTGYDDFREFLLNPGDDYLVGKFGMDRGRVLHLDRSIKRIKRTICSSRRTGGLTKDEASAEWELVARVHTEHDLHDWYNDTQLGDAFELPVYDYSDQIVMFVRKVIPRLRALMRAELAAERGEQPGTPEASR
jgi:hypothetical protein